MTTPPDLLGEWSLSRRVEDLLAARSGTVEGVLSLRRDGEQIEWAESGTLQWGGARTPIHRRYLLQQRDDGWWVLFDDGRLFHPWRPGEWVEHLCGDDRYRGLVALDGPDDWRVRWDVRGPRKVQRLSSRLTAPTG